ncbi:hypothetical protein HID58_080789, partial [Brassica napus]
PPEERVYDPQGPVVKLESEEEVVGEKGDKSWLRVSLASRKLRESISARPSDERALLLPGDYHRIYSPADWNAFVHRHFAGRLFPVNEHAMRTIKNLYVVLEEIWEQGFMALAAVGATNIGSIDIKGSRIKSYISSYQQTPKTLSSGASTTVNKQIHGKDGEVVAVDEQVEKQVRGDRFPRVEVENGDVVVNVEMSGEDEALEIFCESLPIAGSREEMISSERVLCFDQIRTGAEIVRD